MAWNREKHLGDGTVAKTTDRSVYAHGYTGVDALISTVVVQGKVEIGAAEILYQGCQQVMDLLKSGGVVTLNGLIVARGTEGKICSDFARRLIETSVVTRE